MGICLNPGNGLFERAINSKIYVDKTGLIKWTNAVLGTEQAYMCVSRPRRFGKSMAANMLVAYYGRNCDSHELFQNCEIADSDSYEQHLNQYDVIYLNIQHFMGEPEKLEDLEECITQRVLEELKDSYGEYIESEIVDLPSALSKIYAKETRHNKGFVFIVDEWDCIFREAKANEKAQKAYLDFMNRLLKDREYVKLAYMTGILPIKKYGTHSALNIFYEYSMTDPKRLAEYVGFTEAETRMLCDRFSMNFEEVQRWYDGYRFERAEHVYNPKSVVDAMLEEKIKNYWTGTETYEALKVYIDMNYDGLKDAVVRMLAGERCRINSRKFQNDMTTFTSKDDVLTLLVHLGYLAYDEAKEAVYIPNYEIESEFMEAMGNSGWEPIVKMLATSEDLLDATLKMKNDEVANRIDEIHMEATSILNYNDENSLSCVISLAYYSARKDYLMIREMPTGKGFADIVFLPRTVSDKMAMVIELKWDMDAQTAINQIKEKKYVKALENYAGQILLVGINYNKGTKKHECMIEKWDK